DLLNGVLAVAALDNFEAWAVQPQDSFGHQQHARWAGFFIQAASGRQSRAAIRQRLHPTSFAGRNAPGGGQPGSIYAKKRASNMAQRISHLAQSAASANSCSSRVRAWLTTQASAKSASSGACVILA